MADDLEALETWIGGVLAAAGDAGRARVGGKIGQLLRRRNAARIAAQVDPDGQPFAPRKPKRVRRTRKGQIRQRVARRAMFAKARRAQHLTARASAEEVAVGFAANATARIMSVHHFGLKDRVTRGEDHPVAQYPARRLLGFSAEDRDAIMDLVLEHIAAAG